MRSQREVVLSALRKRQLREQVAQKAVGFDPVDLRRLDQAVEGSADVCAAGGTAEQPVFRPTPNGRIAFFTWLVSGVR